MKDFYTTKEISEELGLSVSGVVMYIKRNNLTQLLNKKNGLLGMTSDNLKKFKELREDTIPHQAPTRDIRAESEDKEEDTRLAQFKELYDVILSEKQSQLDMLTKVNIDLREQLKEKDVLIQTLVATNNEQVKVLNTTNQIMALQEPKAKKSLFSRLLGRAESEN